MKKISLLFLIFLYGGKLFPQMFDELKKPQTSDDSKIVITAFTGIASGLYQYDPNVYATGTYSFLEEIGRESLTPIIIPINVNLLFRMNNVSIGPGLDYMLVSTAIQYPESRKLTMGLAKAVARCEIRYGAGSVVDYGMVLQAGAGIVSNPPGADPSTVIGGSVGLYWSLRMTNSLNFFLGVNGGYDQFTTTVYNKPSGHTLISYGLTLGLRFKTFKQKP